MKEYINKIGNKLRLSSKVYICETMVKGVAGEILPPVPSVTKHIEWLETEWTGARTETATLNKDGFVIVGKRANGNAVSVFIRDNELKVFANQTLSVTSASPITKIIFNPMDTAKGRYCKIFPSTGECSYDTVNCITTWEGNATEVVFEVEDKASMGTDGPSKAARMEIQSFDITILEK